MQFCRRALLALAFAFALEAGAVDRLEVLALTKDRAILNIDGNRRVLKSGATSPEGVTLERADSNEAVVVYDGRRETLQVRMVTSMISATDETESVKPTVTLWADPSGFFFADGRINDRVIRFLIDTGANTVAMSEETARSIGLDLSDGRPGKVQTASGVANILGVQLDSVSVGPITVRDVTAGVIPGEFPQVPLLGMSFLNQLDMVRTGNRLELSVR